jgi:hypothetical protein
MVLQLIGILTRFIVRRENVRRGAMFRERWRQALGGSVKALLPVQRLMDLADETETSAKTSPR